MSEHKDLVEILAAMKSAHAKARPVVAEVRIDRLRRLQALIRTHQARFVEAGIADSPEQSADLTAKADAWVTKALEARKGRPRSPVQPEGALDVDGPVPAAWTPPPPPPPPPPKPVR